jgi:hypothetical protein
MWYDQKFIRSHHIFGGLVMYFWRIWKWEIPKDNNKHYEGRKVHRKSPNLDVCHVLGWHMTWSIFWHIRYLYDVWLTNNS